MGRTTPKLPFAVGISTYLIDGFLGSHESVPNRHLDQFSRFCGVTNVTNRQTNRQTNHATLSVHADDPRKLRSHWTEVHQIYTQYSQNITDELFKIRMAILQSVSEHQGGEFLHTYLLTHLRVNG